MEHLVESFWDSFEQYKKNFTVVLTFGILLIFTVFFLQSANAFASTGTIFLNYTFLADFSLQSIIDFVLMVIFLLFFSIFSALMIFAVRKNLSQVKLHYYLTERIQKFGLQLFGFYLLYTLILLLLGTFLAAIGFNFFSIMSLLLIVSIFFSFVPQSIIIDEYNVPDAIMSNFEFIATNFLSFLFIIMISAIILAIIPIIEIGLDSYYYIGSLITLIIVTMFVIPFIEILKTELYLKKFSLIKHTNRKYAY